MCPKHYETKHVHHSMGIKSITSKKVGLTLNEETMMLQFYDFVLFLLLCRSAHMNYRIIIE